MSSIFNLSSSEKKESKESKEPADQDATPRALPPLAKDLYENPQPHLASSSPVPSSPSPASNPGAIGTYAAQAAPQQPGQDLIQPQAASSFPSQLPPSMFAQDASLMHDLHESHDPPQARALELSRPKEPAAWSGLFHPHPQAVSTLSSLQALYASGARQQAPSQGVPQSEQEFATFFGSLQQALAQGDLDVLHRELFERNPLEELKGFHQSNAGTAFVSQDAALRKMLVSLEELKKLEMDWAFSKRDADRATKRMISLEADMNLLLEEVRPFLASVHGAAHALSSPPAPLASSSGAVMSPLRVASDNPADWFYTLDGRVLKSLQQLKEELPFIADHVFNHHVTIERNDFAAWIRGVFKNEAFAKVVESCMIKEQLVRALQH